MMPASIPRRLCLGGLALLGTALLHASQAQAVERLVAGETGWTVDSIGNGLLSMRGSLRVSRDTASTPGTLLILCSKTDDRVLLDPSPTTGIRSAEPSGLGTAAILPAGRLDAEGPALAALKVFRNGSFELSDLSSYPVHAVQSMLGALKAGVDRFAFRLYPVQEARFEQARDVLVQFKLDKVGLRELDRFTTGCLLLQRATGAVQPGQGATPAK